MGEPCVPPSQNDHGLLTWEPAIGRQIQRAPLALRRALHSHHPILRDGLQANVTSERYSAARYFVFSHSVTWTRYSSHSFRFSST